MYRHIPNLLTIGRVIAAPVVALLLLTTDGAIYAGLALVLYTLAAITDWLDGYLARRWQIVSSFGRMLDPIADKLMVITLLVALMGTSLSGPLLFIPALIIVTREIMVSGLREYMSGRNVTIHVTMAAKLKTTFQLVALGCLIASFAFPEPSLLYQIAYYGGFALLWVAAYLTGQTGIAYFKAALSDLKE